MNFTACILIIIPTVLFSLFTLFSHKRLPYAYNLKLVRRVYYIFVILFVSAVLFIYHDDIEKAIIIQIENISRPYVNYLLIFVISTVIAVIWDHLFISCRTLKIFKFKDIELDMSEIDQVKYVDKTQDKQISYLDSVLNAKLEMVKYVDKYVENEDLNPDESYKDIIKEYENKRKNIRVFAYYDDEIELMAKDLSLKTDILSSLLFSISLFGYCIPKEFRKKEYIFAKYKTKYTKNDIIVVLQSDFLVDNEHSMLFDTLNYFEVLIAYNIMQAENENLSIQI